MPHRIWLPIGSVVSHKLLPLSVLLAHFSQCLKLEEITFGKLLDNTNQVQNKMFQASLWLSSPHPPPPAIPHLQM